MYNIIKRPDHGKCNLCTLRRAMIRILKTTAIYTDEETERLCSKMDICCTMIDQMEREKNGEKQCSHHNMKMIQLKIIFLFHHAYRDKHSTELSACYMHTTLSPTNGLSADIEQGPHAHNLKWEAMHLKSVTTKISQYEQHFSVLDTPCAHRNAT